MRVLARPLIYFKSNRPIKNWKLVVSEGMEENYCVSRTDSCCPCDSFLSSQLREWEFLRWEHWGIETLRVCARSQSWQVVKLRRETASDICVLYRREKKKISQRDLGGYFMEDWVWAQGPQVKGETGGRESQPNGLVCPRVTRTLQARVPEEALLGKGE